MIKKRLKKCYTYLFIGALFFTFDLIITAIKIDKIEILQDFQFLSITLLIIFAPFLMSLMMSLLIKSVRDERNKKIMKCVEIIINILLIGIFLYLLFFSLVGLHADWPVPS